MGTQRAHPLELGPILSTPDAEGVIPEPRQHEHHVDSKLVSCFSATAPIEEQRGVGHAQVLSEQSLKLATAHRRFSRFKFWDVQSVPPKGKDLHSLEAGAHVRHMFTRGRAKTARCGWRQYLGKSLGGPWCLQRSHPRGLHQKLEEEPPCKSFEPKTLRMHVESYVVYIVESLLYRRWRLIEL